MIYFDNSATTVPYPEALRTYQEVATKIIGNPSSLHHLGTSASRILEASRKQIAELLKVSSDEIFFTSGGTESDNWAIKGIAFEKQDFGKHIIISAIEHPAVRESAKWLEIAGFEIDIAPVDKNGFLRVESLRELLRPDTILVSIMAVNNEIGSIQPIYEISKLLETYPTIAFHVDAVQALTKLELSRFLTPRVDYASFSGHKFHGPRGVGFLYKKKGKKISSLLSGGGQESDLRSTTENLAGIAATAKALRLAMEKQETSQNLIKKCQYVLQEALSEYPDVVIFSGRPEDTLPHILTFGIKGIRGEVLVHAFEEHDVYISTTSACSSKAGKPAGTLIAMGIPTKLAQTAVRLSLDSSNTMVEIEQFLTLFKQIYQNTKKVRG